MARRERERKDRREKNACGKAAENRESGGGKAEREEKRESEKAGKRETFATVASFA
jgi:hypothetical protein